MDIAKVYYHGKCIMTLDMDYVKGDIIFDYLNEVLGKLQEMAFKEFDLETIYESEAKKVWNGNEELYKLKNQVEQEIESEGFEQVEQLFDIMKERLNDEDFDLFKKLRNEDIICYNKLEIDFYAGEGGLDYVWVERNGQKKSHF